MGGKCRWWGACFAIGALGCTAPQQAAPTAPSQAAPTASPAASSAPVFSARTPEAFRDWARADLERRLPDWQVQTTEDPLTLRVRSARGDLGVWLGRPYEYCSTGGDDCEEQSRHFVAAVAEMANQQGNQESVDSSQLLPAVRSRQDIDSYGPLARELLIEPLAGDLYVVTMLDRPSTASPINQQALGTLAGC